VRGYQEVAFRTAYLITGDASEAEEATQEAFVKAYRALGRFRSGARFRPWLLAIVANEARNQRRAAARRAGLFLRVAREDTPENRPTSPEAAVLAAERREELLEALGGLREGARWAIGADTSWVSPKRRRPPIGLRARNRQIAALAGTQESAHRDCEGGRCQIENSRES
jgi:RNA polymerase sigma factor (sigma-70 family)